MKSPLVKKETYSATHRWDALSRHEQVTIQHVPREGSTYRYEQPHCLKETIEVRSAGFTIEIDIPGLIARAISAAAHSKGGRGTIVGGMVKAKRGAVTVLSTTTRDVPVPSGYEIKGQS